MANAGDEEDETWKLEHTAQQVLYERTKLALKTERACVAALREKVLRLEEQVLRLSWEIRELRPRLITTQTQWKNRRIPGQKDKLCAYETRQYPAGTIGGRYQRWIDGKWVADITQEVEAETAAAAAAKAAEAAKVPAAATEPVRRRNNNQLQRTGKPEKAAEAAEAEKGKKGAEDMSYMGKDDLVGFDDTGDVDLVDAMKQLRRAAEAEPE